MILPPSIKSGKKVFENNQLRKKFKAIFKYSTPKRNIYIPFRGVLGINFKIEKYICRRHLRKSGISGNA